MYEELVERLRAKSYTLEELSIILPRAADAIEELQQIAAHYEQTAKDYWKEACDYKAEIPNWIPVTERLPEVKGRYLVTRGLNACGSLWKRIYIANYSDLMGLKSERIWWQGNVGKSDFERLDDVLAWMSLPEPYNGRKERR